MKKIQLSVKATAATSNNAVPEASVSNAQKDAQDNIVWSSSKPEVAKVDSTTGEVEGVAVGEVTITAKVDGLNVSKTKTITVTAADDPKPTPTTAPEPTPTTAPEPTPTTVPEVPIAKLTTDPTVLTFVVGDEAKVVKAVLSSENDPNGLIKEAEIKWEVTDDSVITISGEAAECTVTAVKAGKASVVATIAGTGYDAVEAWCEVTVTERDTLLKNNALATEVVKDVELGDLTLDGDGVDTSEVSKEMTSEEVAKAVEQAVAMKEEVAASVTEEKVKLAVDASEPDHPVNQLQDVFGEEEIEEGVKAADLVVEVKPGNAKTKIKFKEVNGEIQGILIVTNVTINITVGVQDGDDFKEVSLVGKTTKNITVPVMIPETVDEDAGWATITHNVRNGKTWKTSVKRGNNGRYIDVASKHFSPFDITFSVDEPDLPTADELEDDDNNNSNPGGYSSGGRSSGGSRPASNNTIAGTLAGQWQMNETGWWFRLDDGSYAVNSWQYVAYNGVARWYRFDANGYICKGWFTDADGHRYYLNPVSDGLMGSMLTGWQQIDGIWYYFNTVSDGTQGALLVNTTTPDGYNVDANGQWIQ